MFSCVSNSSCVCFISMCFWISLLLLICMCFYLPVFLNLPVFVNLSGFLFLSELYNLPVFLNLPFFLIFLSFFNLHVFLNLLDVLSLLSLSFLISMNFSNLQLTTLTLLSPIFHPTPTSQSLIKQQDIIMFLFLSPLFPYFILLPLHRVQWNNTIYLCFGFTLFFLLLFILLSFRKAYKTISKNLHYLIVLFIDQTIRNLST